MVSKRWVSLLGGGILLGCLMSAIAPVDGTFGYQGRLTNTGAPVTGTVDLRFRLYDDSLAGSEIGLEIEMLGVAVDGGLFNVNLDFGVGALNGEQRWLEIDARSPAGVGGYTTLAPRQPLLGAPYAIQTRGLFVDEDNNVGIGTTEPAATLHIESNESRSIYATNSNFAGAAVFGDYKLAGDPVGGDGVVGQTDDGSGIAVYGNNLATAGDAIGVRGASHGTGGYGVYGLTLGATGTGVYAGATSQSGENYGLYATSNSTSGVGAYGLAVNFEGNTIGVKGESLSPTGYGVIGQATRASGINFGVCGKTASAIGYAGYFEGGRNYFERNVGIGTPAPLSLLHITHPAIGAGWAFRIQNSSIASFACGMRISDGGFLDITNTADTPSPSFARLNSTGNWTVVSDIRMKEEIAPLGDVLDRAMALNPISFRYKQHDRAQSLGRQIGFSAQGVEPLFPSLVTHGDDVLTMNYNGLSVVAVAALQELKTEKDAEIGELRRLVDSLRARNETLDVGMVARDARIGDLAERIERLELLLAELVVERAE